MSKALTMDQLIEAEERARVAEGKAVEYQNKYYAEKQKCQNTHERALRYLKEHGLLDIKFRRAEAEVRRLQAVFDMQQTRMDDATVMWQADTGKHDTLPDLGVLLDWLMGEIK